MANVTPTGYQRVFQPLCAAVFVAIVLLLFNLIHHTNVLWAVGAGALSSSAFIVFTVPSSAVAKSSRLIGGYLIGIITGVLVHLVLVDILSVVSQFLQINSHLFWVAAAITVALSMSIMLAFKVPHPPAAGVALVLVLDISHYEMVLIIFGAVLILALMKWLLRGYLVDLIE